MPFFFFRIVRLTSPNLNYLIIIGTILLYTTVIFFVFPTTDATYQTIFCHVSYSSVFGCVFCTGLLLESTSKLCIVHRYETPSLCRYEPEHSSLAISCMLVTCTCTFCRYVPGHSSLAISCALGPLWPKCGGSITFSTIPQPREEQG